MLPRGRKRKQRLYEEVEEEEQPPDWIDRDLYWMSLDGKFQISDSTGGEERATTDTSDGEEWATLGSRVGGRVRATLGSS